MDRRRWEEGERAKCRAKHAYLSGATAWSAVVAFALIWPDLVLYAYPCLWCPDWHVTRRPCPVVIDRPGVHAG